MSKLQIFVGWDPREDIAWQVCAHSIMSRTDPTCVSVRPLKQGLLRSSGLYTRPIDKAASTEFSLTRFLTPTLAGTEGFALFVDCDFLFTCDVREVLNSIDESTGVSVVKHDYSPSTKTKMDGKPQHIYPRKNWSSFMVFNLGHPAVRNLSPEVVNSETPAYLHRFGWIEDESIGALDPSWNYLADWYPTTAKLPNAIHYTEGGPWFIGRQNCAFADAWMQERDQMNHSIPISA